MAAEAGECEKDLGHDKNVAAARGIFYPLIVETNGVWSMHSLEVLKSIAKKTSLFNELTFSRTLSNLHEQLSCKLWQYNGKLIVDKLALFSYDIDSFNIVFKNLKYIHISISIYIEIHTYIHTYIYIYVCMYVCMHVCMYVLFLMYLHVPIRTNSTVQC